MAEPVNYGFCKPQSEIFHDIYIPKYYDPSIDRRLDQLSTTHDLVPIGDLIDQDELSVHTGHDIGKFNYGLGSIPYVRTSDIATWEITSAPKQTINEAAYAKYSTRQDVRAGDVFFVRDGLYLIGLAALVTDADLPLIHQSHLLRFRPAEGAPIDSALLLALLSTPIVRRQVRAKQFTAGIIDKIEERYRELILPVPKSRTKRRSLSREVLSIVRRRVELREQLRAIPFWVQGITRELTDPLADRGLLPLEGPDRIGFVQSSSAISGNIYIPKYYDPGVTESLRRMRSQFTLSTIGDLATSGWLQLETGIEVGKLAYGLGPIPFIRTSDLTDWELATPKQRVSEELYAALRRRTDIRVDDILLVRDGTYLIGTSAIITNSDFRALYSGGLYKIRVVRRDVFDPYLLLALLNIPIVKRQIRAKQFTRDIIDTIGKRLSEVVLPIPRSEDRAREIANQARTVVKERVRLRDRARKIALSIEGTNSLDEYERELAIEMPI